MMSQAGVAEKMFKTLAKNEINIFDEQKKILNNFQDNKIN